MVSIKRPYFGPRQVRTLRSIKPGLILKCVHSLGSEVILVLSDPYEFNSGLCFDYAYYPLKYRFVETASCADRGIVPYVGGYWNRNHLLRTGRKKLTSKEVKAIRANLIDLR